MTGILPKNEVEMKSLRGFEYKPCPPCPCPGLRYWMRRVSDRRSCLRILHPTFRLVKPKRVGKQIIAYGKHLRSFQSKYGESDWIPWLSNCGVLVAYRTVTIALNVILDGYPIFHWTTSRVIRRRATCPREYY